MSRIKEKTSKIQKSRYTYYISIPADLIRELDWRERQKVVVKKRGKGLSIVDWEKKAD